MIKVIVICIMVGLLYIAISIILYPFNKQLNDLEFRILKLEQRIENYKREYKKQLKNISEFDKKKVKKNEK